GRAQKTGAEKTADNKAAGDKAAEKGSPERTAQAGEQVKNDLQRAATNLSAREQQIERDKAVGEAIAQLAKQQQKAAEDIAKARGDLEKLAKADPRGQAGEPGGKPMGEPGGEKANPTSGDPAGEKPSGEGQP